MNTLPAFKERVLDVVRHIPKGTVATYGQIARLSGAAGAARAVGTIMKGNHDPSVPCHRVVRSDGKLGEYNREGGTNTKSSRLKEEGAFTPEGRLIHWNP